MSKWDKEKANLKDLILVQKLSYEEIGRQYGCSGSNIRKVARLQGIELPQRRSTKEGETFDRNKKESKLCLSCGKEILSRNIYCNNTCQNDYEYRMYIEGWKRGLNSGSSGIKILETSNHVRRYLFNKYSNSCQKCGWNIVNVHTNLVPLTIHHIDGDSNNNEENNLELLCPNCHSLTNNYGNRNKKSSRVNRSK